MKPDGLVAKALSFRFMQLLGNLSFGVYLWHFPIVIIGNAVGLPTSQPLRTFILVASSYLLAFITYKLLESPIRSINTDHPAKVLLGGLLLSLAVAGFCFFVLTGNCAVQEVYENAHKLQNADDVFTQNGGVVPLPENSAVNFSGVSTASGLILGPEGKPYYLVGMDSFGITVRYMMMGLTSIFNYTFTFELIAAHNTPWFEADKFAHLPENSGGLDTTVWIIHAPSSPSHFFVQFLIEFTLLSVL